MNVHYYSTHVFRRCSKFISQQQQQHGRCIFPMTTFVNVLLLQRPDGGGGSLLSTTTTTSTGTTRMMSTSRRGITTNDMDSSSSSSSSSSTSTNTSTSTTISASIFKNPIVHELWTARQKAKQELLTKDDNPNIDQSNSNKNEKSPRDSFVEVSYPFSTDTLLWEAYRNPW